MSKIEYLTNQKKKYNRLLEMAVAGKNYTEIKRLQNKVSEVTMELRIANIQNRQIVHPLP